MNISKERLGQLFILVGPGGAGKNTLMNHVLDRIETLKQLPTATTRPIRENEQHGREHVFLSVEAFQELIANNALIEYQEVRPGQFYGVPRATVQNAIDDSRDLIADIEVLGASILREEYPDNTMLIFIAPPSMDRLKTQMRERGTDEATIKDRMLRAAMEMPYAPLCDHIVINDDLDRAIDELYGIIERAQNHNDYTKPDMHQVNYEARGVVFNTDNTMIDPTLSAPVPVGESPGSVILHQIEHELSISTHPDTLSQQSPNDTVTFYPISITQNDEGEVCIRYTYAYTLNETDQPKLSPYYHWKPVTTLDLK